MNVYGKLSKNSATPEQGAETVSKAARLVRNRGHRPTIETELHLSMRGQTQARVERRRQESCVNVAVADKTEPDSGPMTREGARPNDDSHYDCLPVSEMRLHQDHQAHQR